MTYPKTPDGMRALIRELRWKLDSTARDLETAKASLAKIDDNAEAWRRACIATIEDRLDADMKSRLDQTTKIAAWVREQGHVAMADAIERGCVWKEADDAAVK